MASPDSKGATARRDRVADFKRAMARRRARAKKRGIALIMVLGAITIMTVFLTELQTDTSAAVAGALAERDRLKAEYYAKSAINLSRLLLAAEKPIRTTVGPMVQLLLGSTKPPQIPVWEFSDMVLGAFNGGDHATQFGSKVGVDISTAKNLGIPGNGYFNVSIIDEDSKININSAAAAITPPPLVLGMMVHLAQPQYVTMFEQPDADNQLSDSTTLCASLLDWVDPDENLANCIDVSKGSNGSEDNIYQMLGLQYRRKNAPFDSLEELRLVRGMDDDRWTTFVDPEPDEPHKRLFTVWGQEGINVNTANAQNIWIMVCATALPLTPVCTDPVQAGMFLQVFSLVRTFARGAPLFPLSSTFRKAMEGQGMIGQFLTSLGVTPVAFDKTKFKNSDLRKQFKVESKLFSIYAEGVVPGTKREARVRIHAVVDMRSAVDWKQSLDPNAQLNQGAVNDAQEEVAEAAEFQKELTTNPFGQVVYYRVD